MEKIANFFHQGHHDSNSQENFSHNHHGNHKSPEFQSNPIPPTKIACEDGVLDVCLLGKDTLGVCSYLKKEITVYDITGKKLFALITRRFPQYLDGITGGMVFSDLDENSVFKAAFPPSNPREEMKDVEMVPKKKEKSELKKKLNITGSSKSSEKDSKAAKKQSKEKAKSKEDEKMEVDNENPEVEKESGKLNDGTGTADKEEKKRDLKEETVVGTGQWIPKGVHTTKSGDILVCLWNGQRKEKSHGKVIKYSKMGKELKEFDSHNHRAFFACPMYVTENGLGDICVSDWNKKSVVVVSKSSSKKFEYEGHKEQNDEENKFDPRGICTDSFHHIIVADYWHHRLHVLDDKGHFLRYFVYDNIRGPTGMCIDENNILYVGELGGKSVNVIKYLK